jgi:hypothetical protein
MHANASSAALIAASGIDIGIGGPLAGRAFGPIPTYPTGRPKRDSQPDEHSGTSTAQKALSSALGYGRGASS